MECQQVLCYSIVSPMKYIRIINLLQQFYGIIYGLKKRC